MKNIFGVLFFFFSMNVVFGQGPVLKWQESFGGSGLEQSYCIIQTPDNGYIVSGYTESNNTDVNGNHGDSDLWVVKLNSSRVIEWQKCLGGTLGDYGSKVNLTNDGGYIVIGGTESNDGDVSGNHGGEDAWVVKLNNIGTIEWQKCYGGTLNDNFNSVTQTSEGGYIVAGSTDSNDGDVIGNHGGTDGWVLKLNNIGVIEWQKCLGGSSADGLEAILQTSDNGFIIAGGTGSTNGDITTIHGLGDAWIIKLNPSGAIVWQKCVGGSMTEWAQSIKATSDGGYVFSGESQSNDGDIPANYGFNDAIIVKMTSTGNIEWINNIGGTNQDWAWNVIEVTTGGYIFTGYTQSFDGDVFGNHGQSDAWVVKVNNTGSLEWQKCFGGTGVEVSRWAQELADGSFVIAGCAYENNGDVTGNHGQFDFWIVGFCVPPITIANEIACDSLVWQDGLTYYSSNNWSTYTILAGSYNGCDSIVKLNLIINHSSSNTLNEVLAPNYILNGQTYTLPGTYYQTISNSVGCDSLITLNLGYAGLNEMDEKYITLSPNPTTFKISIKSSLEWKGKEFSIYDQLGKAVKSGIITSENTEIDLSNLTEGTYLFKVGSEMMESFKIIKQ